jgi:delta8-fatty-acid desaturase
MKRFEIGYVDEPWENFVPPIQGGKFGNDLELPEVTREQLMDGSSSDDSSCSRSPTPTFDSSEIATPGLRSRLGIDSSSSSSLSSPSLTDAQETAANETNPLAFLDVRTQEELDLDLAAYPDLDPDTQKNIVEKYRLLEIQMYKDGLFDCNYYAYAVESCRYLLLATASLLFLRAGWYATSGGFLGLLWHQLVFTVHDAGHMGITHNFTVDSMIGMTIANYIGGLSLGWWKHSHNVHHIVTNSPEHDPDIEHVPFFAISNRFFKSLFSTYYGRIMPYDAFSKVLIPYQHMLYYPILAFGRFNLYRLSWAHLFQGIGPRKGIAWWHRWFEMAGQVFFWYWYGYLVVYQSIPTWSGRLSFILISHMLSSPLHVQITLSHFAMSTSELGPQESFPQKMLRTTMDVACPQWLDFIHGGLQFQAIHHLFPRMPRHNLRAAQKLVIAFCEDVKIPYALYGFVDGNKKVIGRLGDVGQQAAIFAACQKSIAKSGHMH